MVRGRKNRGEREGNSRLGLQQTSDSGRNSQAELREKEGAGKDLGECASRQIRNHGIKWE